MLLKLFQSIFGAETATPASGYPETLIQAAIDRALAATDPRLRYLRGHAKRLRGPVIRAIDQVVALVDALPAPLPATRAGYGQDARLAALFSSADRMLEVLGQDAALAAALEKHPHSPQFALLLCERVEKKVLGMEVSGELMQREVAQTSVSFRAHRLVDPQLSEDEMRRQLKRRAFDHLLALALARISDARDERADLVRQRTLLRGKLAALDRQGWGFDSGEAQAPADLDAALADIEQQLDALGREDSLLATEMEQLAEVLDDAPQQLRSEALSLWLDGMNIQRRADEAGAREIPLTEVCNARGRRLILLPLRVEPGELPRREDFLTAAQRHLY